MLKCYYRYYLLLLDYIFVIFFFFLEGVGEADLFESDCRKSTRDGHCGDGKRATRTQCNNQILGRLGYQRFTSRRQTEHGNTRTACALVERRQICDVCLICNNHRRTLGKLTDNLNMYRL